MVSIASPKAIIATARKSVPSAIGPTPAPQLPGTPYYGAVSPLVQDLTSGGSTGPGYAGVWTSGLPRPPAVFTQGAFGPFSPILPVPVDAPEPDGRPQPRREQYQVGWNLPTGEPGTEGLKLADFGTLRTLADLYSVARACIELRKDEIKGLEWDILPTADAAKSMRSSKSEAADFGKRRSAAIKFFNHPDPDYFNWGSWISDVMEQIFVYDALSIVLRPKWGKGQGKGLLGSDLDSLNLIDGATIRPLYDLTGAKPRPPAPAYEQYLYGIPRTDLMSIITHRDLESGGLAGSEWKKYRGDQLLYLPMVPRRWSPYGFAPIERALIPIMSGLQKQAFQLDYFREGTVPAVFVSPGDLATTPTQVRELQDALNAIAGDPAWHHRIIVLPPGSKVDPQRQAQLADQFDEIVRVDTCMAFGVSPMELGIAPKVSTTVSPGSANQMAKQSQNSMERKATRPTLRFLADIMDYVLHHVAGQDDMRFVFDGLEDDEDEAQQTQTLAAQINVGLRSIDEGREELGMQPWGLPETQDPGWATMTGFVPLGQVGADGQAAPGAQPDAAQPAIAPAPAQPGQPPAGGTPAPAPGQPKPKPAAAGSAQSPGHSAAQAAQSQADSKPGTMERGARTAAKSADGRALANELDCLARHLNKGRALSSWEPKHIPGAVLAGISEDMAKGLTADQACQVAGDLLGKAGGPPADGGPDQPDGAQWPGWLRDQALGAIYAQRLSAAFTAAMDRIRELVRGFTAGERHGTAEELATEIRDQVEEALTSVLPDAQAEGYALGQVAAEAVLTDSPPDWGGWDPGDHDAARKIDSAGKLRALLNSQGIDSIKAVADTRFEELATAITEALDRGDGYAALVKEIEPILDLPQRAEMIARTEIARAAAAATMDSFQDAKVGATTWLTAPGDKVCIRCQTASDAGPVKLGDPFPVAEVASPPAHPMCRCVQVPAESHGVDLTGKVMRRRVGTNGQEAWYDIDDPEVVAAGGGSGPLMAHDADGIQHAAKAAQGYSLSPRSGMISLDLPSGLIKPLPGGVTDHHITVVYLGPDVDDRAFAEACNAAQDVAASMQPLAAAVGGIGSFPAGEDGVPVWAGVSAPGIQELHAALAHLQSPDSATAKSGSYKPHMTLAYLAEGDPMPGPVPYVPVMFDHLTVHRGGDVARFPFGVGI